VAEIDTRSADGGGTTMRTLHLLRHLKSSWDDPGLADHDRPLAPRGHRAARRIRRHIRASGFAPQLVMCSSAARAVQTWESIRRGIGADVELEVSDELYLATGASLLLRLNQVPDAVDSALLVGHSPGIADLAAGLSGTGGGQDIDRMTTKFPTGGLATLTFDGPWSSLSWGDAHLAEFVVPRQL
jgi:phosphohistidine phosphatase